MVKWSWIKFKICQLIRILEFYRYPNKIWTQTTFNFSCWSLKANNFDSIIFLDT